MNEQQQYQRQGSASRQQHAGNGGHSHSMYAGEQTSTTDYTSPMKNRSHMARMNPHSESKRQTKQMSTTLQATANHKPMSIDTHLPHVKNMHGGQQNDM